MANSVEWNTWAIDFLQMLVHTDTLKMLSRLHIGRTNSVCDLCSCSCLDTRIHRHTHMINFSSACDESARITVKVMHGWCWYASVYLCFSSSSTSNHHDDDHIFSCLFVCCFSLIYSQWESLMELWLDRIGLDWIGFELRFGFRFLDSVFGFSRSIVLFVRLFRAILPIHRVLFWHTHKHNIC